MIALTVVTIDVAAKLLATSFIARGDRVGLLPGVALVSSRNHGVAFGLLAGVPTVALLTGALAVLSLLGVVAWRATGPSVWVPAGMVLGGAVANLADRVADGAVTDFIQLPHWPAFNLADVAITLGAAGLALGLGRDRPSAPPARDGPAAAGGQRASRAMTLAARRRHPSDEQPSRQRRGSV